MRKSDDTVCLGRSNSVTSSVRGRPRRTGTTSEAVRTSSGPRMPNSTAIESTDERPPAGPALCKPDHRCEQAAERIVDEWSLDDLTVNTPRLRGGTPWPPPTPRPSPSCCTRGSRLDLVGPLQALSLAPRIDPTFEVVVVGETTDVQPTDSVVQLAPSHTFEQVPALFAIVVPGGGQPTLAACGNQRLIDYVSRPRTPPPRSSCPSAPAPSSWPAGLLDDRPATTHWAYVDILEGLGATHVHQRWVEHGKYLTTAGVRRHRRRVPPPPGWSVRTAQADPAGHGIRASAALRPHRLGTGAGRFATTDPRGPLAEELARHLHLARRRSASAAGPHGPPSGDSPV